MLIDDLFRSGVTVVGLRPKGRGTREAGPRDCPYEYVREISPRGTCVRGWIRVDQPGFPGDRGKRSVVGALVHGAEAAVLTDAKPVETG